MEWGGPLSDERRWLLLVCSLTLVHGLVYALLVPPWQAPDEWAHFESANLVAHWWRLQLGEEDQLPGVERELIASFYEFEAWRLSSAPPFILSSPGTMPTRLSDVPRFGVHRTVQRVSVANLPYAIVDRLVLHQDVIVQLLVLRAFSVLVNVLLVWVCWRTAQELFPPVSPPLLAAVLLFVLHPQHTFVHAAVNDGNLADLMTGVVFLLLVQCWQRGWTWQRTAGMVAAAALALWSKPTAYFLIVYLPLAAGLYAVRHGSLGRDRHVIALLLVGIVIAGFLVPRSINLIRRVQVALSAFSDLSYVAEWAQRTAQQLFYMWWADVGTQRSNFLGPEIYILLAGFGIGGLTGWVRLVARPGPRAWLRDVTSRALLLTLGLAVVTISILYTVGLIGNPNVVGRYLFPAFIPTVIVLVAGWAEWIPARLHRPALAAFLLLLLLLDTWVIMGHVIARYYAV